MPCQFSQASLPTFVFQSPCTTRISFPGVWSMAFCSWSEKSSTSLSSKSDIGEYAFTSVMLKGTALRWMVISLLETGWHSMRVFMMSLWTTNQTPCSSLSSFKLKKTLCPSSVVILPKFFHLISESKDVPAVPVHFVCYFLEFPCSC